MKIDNAFWTIADSTVEQNDAIHQYTLFNQLATQLVQLPSIVCDNSSENDCVGGHSVTSKVKHCLKCATE